MIVQCEKCATTYHLDQQLIEPFGSKVRCSRCSHIFWIEPSSFSETPPFSESISEPQAFLPLEQEQEEEEAALQIRPARKSLWVLGILLGLVLLALGVRFFYIQNLHPKWNIPDIFSSVFFLPVDPEGNQKISLINIKKYFKENQKAGRFFIVEGEIKNGYPNVRQRVKIGGSLRMADNRVAVGREVYAGWTLTNEELESLSLEEINRLTTSQPERFSPSVRALPGKTLPFMIIFPPLPLGSSQVSIEVISSEKAQPHSLLKSFTG